MLGLGYRRVTSIVQFHTAAQLMKLYYPSYVIYTWKRKPGSKSSCVFRLTLPSRVCSVSQNCALNSQIFFFLLDCFLCSWKKACENMYNLENASEHSVCKKFEAKCEGVSFPGGVTDFILWCADAECFSRLLRNSRIFARVWTDPWVV